MRTDSPRAASPTGAEPDSMATQMMFDQREYIPSDSDKARELTGDVAQRVYLYNILLWNYYLCNTWWRRRSPAPRTSR
jgi:hypothetical protein